MAANEAFCSSVGRGHGKGVGAARSQPLTGTSRATIVYRLNRAADPQTPGVPRHLNVNPLIPDAIGQLPRWRYSV
jgi:hypothetical protein